MSMAQLLQWPAIGADAVHVIACYSRLHDRFSLNQSVPCARLQSKRRVLR